MKIIAEELLKIKAIQINTKNPFTWASGIISPIYCDNRLINSYPQTRDLVEQEFASMIQEKFPDVEMVLGTATAGISHAALIANILKLPMGYVRSSKKEHGKQNLIEGFLPEKTKVVIIEDLLSTGKSSLEAYKGAIAAGANVLGIAAIFSYNLKKLTTNFQQIKYSTLTNIDELLEVAEIKKIIDKQDVEKVKDFLEGLNK